MNELAEIEQRVRRTCTAIADRTVVGTHPLPTGSVDGRIVGPDRRRVALRLAAAAAVVAVLGVAAIVAADRSDDSGSVATGTMTEGRTAPLPEAPIVGRMYHNAVWTGSEMIVFGGYDGGEAWGAAGAAAYDPQRRSWRHLADPPEGLDFGYNPNFASNVVWTGTEVVAFALTVDGDQVGDGPSLGAIYDVADDEWRPISNPGFGEPGQAFWIGDKVLVTGFSASGGTRADAVGVATYDPSTDRWHALPDAPVNLSTAVWTGRELIYAGDNVEPETGDMPLSMPHGTIAVALDPATEQWRTLPAPPLERREDAIVAWTGTELVIAGGGSPADDSAPGGRPLASGASFDPVTETWTELPAAPTWFFGSVGTDAAVVDGRLVAFHTGDPGHRPLVLDLATRTWRYGPADPDGERKLGTTIAADHEILVWGGVIGSSETPIATGISYTPPR